MLVKKYTPLYKLVTRWLRIINVTAQHYIKGHTTPTLIVILDSICLAEIESKQLFVRSTLPMYTYYLIRKHNNAWMNQITPSLYYLSHTQLNHFQKIHKSSYSSEKGGFDSYYHRALSAQVSKESSNYLTEIHTLFTTIK